MGKIDVKEFKKLLNNVEYGWSNQDTPLALSSFSTDAVYMEPPNIQLYVGHKQLKPYFEALGPEHRMKFHNIWFDESSQTGAAEFTFSYGEKIADVGIIVVEIKDGKISSWREYHRKGPVDFREFLSTKNKDWKWTIENYP